MRLGITGLTEQRDSVDAQSRYSSFERLARVSTCIASHVSRLISASPATIEIHEPLRRGPSKRSDPRTFHALRSSGDKRAHFRLNPVDRVSIPRIKATTTGDLPHSSFPAWRYTHTRRQYAPHQVIAAFPSCSLPVPNVAG